MLVAVVAAGLAGCASVYNLPGNVPLGAAAADANGVSDIPTYEDDLLLALSFSGGGTRAAAFSFGVLEELDRVHSGAAGTKTLLDRVDFVSGVSGGSITAAYFGLKRRAALDDFRERFLLRNAEEGLKTQISLGNIGRALGGGVNDSQFTDWLDRNLFNGARFEALPDDRRPRVWINASDIYNRTPFVFGKTSFDALCSDIRSYRVAEAVAASAAVPLAFAPIKPSPAAARRRCRPGSSGYATIPTRSRCCAPMPRPRHATATARCATSSCSMAGWSTITACRD